MYIEPINEGHVLIVAKQHVDTIEELSDETEMLDLYDEMAKRETAEAKVYKAIDSLEALVQHNISELSTWIPKEYELNKTYADDKVAFSEYLKELREEISVHLKNTWESIVNDTNHHLIVCEVVGKIVASCVCVIIPNLTRNVRPYAFVENVVTHGEFRKKGYATACLNYAKRIAEENSCYKMMLLTGSKEERTLNFYRNAGYNSSDKTAFIQWIDM